MKTSAFTFDSTRRFLKRAFFGVVLVASLGLSVATPAAEGFSLVSASSVQDQGGQTFGIEIYLTGGSVECRSAKFYTLVFTFSDTITSANATLASGIGQIFYESTIDNTLTVSLKKVADVQTIQVDLDNVHSTSGEVLPPTHINLGMLIGDVDQNQVVDEVDAKVTRNTAGRPIENNYRKDVTVDGIIDRQDLQVVRRSEGHTLR